ncbi:MAG: ComF family protein [Spirochaetia bacterium]|nr:ComF family protein [Spirochaetia bacterium]
MAVPLHFLGSIIAPRYCVLCASPLGVSDDYPLCDACARTVLEQAQACARLERCASCGKPLISEHGRCTRCRVTTYGFDSAFPIYSYSGDVRRLILAYKSGGRRSLALFFAGLVATALDERYPGRIIVPVPPRHGKLRRKGWDQVEDIVRILESQHGYTVRRLLVRSGGNQQKALGLEARVANMHGTIQIGNDMSGRPHRIPDQPVLLDDVLTTGATLSACAELLKASGSSRVDAIAIAAD